MSGDCLEKGSINCSELFLVSGVGDCKYSLRPDRISGASICVFGFRVYCFFMPPFNAEVWSRLTSTVSSDTRLS